MPSTGVSLVHTSNGRAKSEADERSRRQVTIAETHSHCQYAAVSVSRGVIASITHCIRARIRKMDEEAAQDGEVEENGNTIYESREMF